MVDDVITNGSAKLDALKPLFDEGLRVKDLIVLIDREQGGAAQLTARGIALHAVLTLRQALDAFVDGGRMSAAQRGEVLNWLNAQR
jgi:orotate phosphoribosyltransferase